MLEQLSVRDAGPQVERGQMGPTRPKDGESKFDRLIQDSIDDSPRHANAKERSTIRDNAKPRMKKEGSQSQEKASQKDVRKGSSKATATHDAPAEEGSIAQIITTASTLELDEHATPLGTFAPPSAEAFLRKDTAEKVTEPASIAEEPKLANTSERTQAKAISKNVAQAQVPLFSQTPKTVEHHRDQIRTSPNTSVHEILQAQVRATQRGQTKAGHGKEQTKSQPSAVAMSSTEAGANTRAPATLGEAQAVALQSVASDGSAVHAKRSSSGTPTVDSPSTPEQAQTTGNAESATNISVMNVIASSAPLAQPEESASKATAFSGIATTQAERIHRQKPIPNTEARRMLNAPEESDSDPDHERSVPVQKFESVPVTPVQESNMPVQKPKAMPEPPPISNTEVEPIEDRHIVARDIKAESANARNRASVATDANRPSEDQIQVKHMSLRSFVATKPETARDGLLEGLDRANSQSRARIQQHLAQATNRTARKTQLADSSPSSQSETLPTIQQSGTPDSAQAKVPSQPQDVAYAQSSPRNVQELAKFVFDQAQQIAQKPGHASLELDFSSTRLGNLNITVQHNAGQLSVTVQADTDNTRQELLDQRDELARQLRQMGYGQVDVDIESQNKDEKPDQEMQDAEKADENVRFRDENGNELEELR